MKIVTLTLNPAFDVHCFAENFKPYHESIAKITSKEAGGKGVNVSRALQANGVDNLAVVIVGTDNGEEFVKALKKDGLNVAPVYVDGRIRENITLHEMENPETRISFDGFECNESVLLQVQLEIGAVDENTIVSFTGSIPKGISTTAVLTMLDKLKKQGAKIVIDSRSVSLEQLEDFKPWLIKPNKDEAKHYTGIELNDIENVAKFAKELYANGVENAMISLGENGAVLACEQGVFYAKTPKIEVRSTIGAGDSTIAGFMQATANKNSQENVLRRAMAFGVSACMQEGTLPPLSEDVDSVEKNVEIIKIS